MARIRWNYILLYYSIALAIALPFNTGMIYRWIDLPASIARWRSWLFVPAALGPLMAASLCYRLDRATSRRIDLFGRDRVGSLLTAMIPLLAFTFAGYLSGGARGLLYGAAGACVALIYSLGEEAGWRGYLQDALVPLRAPLRYLLVGILWWVWHARFANYFEWAVFPLIVIASAFVLGHVAEKTRSLLVVASMHSVIMLLTMNGSVGPAYAAGGVAILLGWILVGRLRRAKAYA